MSTLTQTCAHAEAPLIRQILLSLALALPQSVYLPLRSFALNLREAVQRSALDGRNREKAVRH